MQRERAIEILRTHAGELKRRGVTGLYLFGSVARGEARPESDIDLFFDYRQDGHFSLFEVMDLHDYVESLLQTKADVIPRNSLHRRIREKVIGEATKVF